MVRRMAIFTCCQFRFMFIGRHSCFCVASNGIVATKISINTNIYRWKMFRSPKIRYSVSLTNNARWSSLAGGNFVRLFGLCCMIASDIAFKFVLSHSRRYLCRKVFAQSTPGIWKCGKLSGIIRGIGFFVWIVAKLCYAQQKCVLHSCTLIYPPEWSTSIEWRIFELMTNFAHTNCYRLAEQNHGPPNYVNAIDIEAYRWCFVPLFQ